MIDEREVKVKFGNAIKKVRSQRQLSQEELAEKSGLHRTYISEVERGDRNLSLVNIVKLCDALECRPSKLFELIEWEP